MIKRKYFKKLFAFYFVIMLVYGFILTSFFVFHNQNTIIKQQEYNNSKQASQIATYLDQKLLNIDKYTETLFQDPMFNDYLIFLNDYYIYTQVHDKLRLDMTVFIEMGARIAVTKWEDNFVISNQYTGNIQRFQEEMLFSDAQIKLMDAFYYNQHNNKELLIFSGKDNEQLHIVKKKKANTKQYILVIMTISECDLEKSLGNNLFDFYIEGAQNGVDDLSLSVINNEKQHLIINDDFYSVIPSDVFDKVNYVINIKSRADYSVFNIIMLAIVLMIFILFIGYMVALIITKKVYKPIGKVLIGFGELGDTFDEFSYIENQRDLILESNNQLRKVIEKQKVDLRTKFLRDILYGRINDRYEKEKMSDYCLKWLEEDVVVAIVELQELQIEKSAYLSQAKANIIGELKSIMENTLAMEAFNFELIELSYMSFVLILGVDSEEKTIELLQSLLSKIKANEEIDLRIYIGNQNSGIQGLRSSFDSAKTVMDFRQNYDQRALITSGDIISNNFYYTLEQERELFKATVNGEAEKINVIFERIIKYNVSEINLNSKEELGLFMSLATTYRRIQQKVDLKDKASGLEETIRIITYENNTLTAMLEVFKNHFIDIAQEVKQKNESTDTAMSTIMIKFIEDHYSEDISLEEASACLNISAGYFSTVFKEQTGSNFKSYLNLYRVNKAKEILEYEPTIKIKDLTLRVGYNNVNSFIRMFKKYEGISPGGYAKRLNKN